MYQNVDSKTKFEDIVRKVKGWVTNRVALINGPAPVNIGEVGWASDDCGGDTEETAIYMIGSWTKCHRWSMVTLHSEIVRLQSRAEARTGKTDRRTSLRYTVPEPSSPQPPQRRRKGQCEGQGTQRQWGGSLRNLLEMRNDWSQGRRTHEALYFHRGLPRGAARGR